MALRDRQKQVDSALERAFSGRAPSGKVKITISAIADIGSRILTLHHYQHVLLRMDLEVHPPRVLHTIEGQSGWKPTDFRILRATLAGLAAMSREQIAGGTMGSGLSLPSASSDSWGTQVASLNTVQTERCSLSHGLGEVTIAVGCGVVEKGSRFVAAVAFPCPTEAHARAAIAMLRTHRALSGATHRITAFRAGAVAPAAPPAAAAAVAAGSKRKQLKRTKPAAEGCDDDGEARGGSSLRAALRKENVIGAVAVVARWYGGVNIGKARFRHIQERAITALRAAGHVPGRSLREAAWSYAGAGHSLLGSNSSGGGGGDNGGGEGGGRAAKRASSSGGGIAAWLRKGNSDEKRKRREMMAAAAERRVSASQEEAAAAAAAAEPPLKAGKRAVTTAPRAAAAAVSAPKRPRLEEERRRSHAAYAAAPASAPAAPSRARWSCPRCTLFNDASRSACSVCAGPRPPPPRLPAPAPAAAAAAVAPEALIDVVDLSQEETY